MKTNINKSYTKVIDYIEYIISAIKKKIEKSIRFELMIVIGICFLISFFFYSFTNNFLKREYTEPQISYDYDSVERLASDLASDIESQDLLLDDKDALNETLSTVPHTDKCYITDLDGNVLFKTDGVSEETIDIYSALKDAMTSSSYEKIGVVKKRNI